MSASPATPAWQNWLTDFRQDTGRTPEGPEKDALEDAFRSGWAEAFEWIKVQIMTENVDKDALN